MMRGEDFVEFYREIHGHEPFDWQRQLVLDVIEHGSWPALVDAPTGMGKTALLDIAVFLTAVDTDAPARTRLGRRRVFFVVDRRIVVDQAHERAQRISTALDAASEHGVVGEVARRLVALGPQRGPDSPHPTLSVVKMRGGTTWDAAWVPRPDLPAIVSGTVDQVGSRLFFRGYGVSKRRWPIDAALVGTDSLILVDEAHLASALVTSLDSALGYDATQAEMHLPAPAVVHLSATAGDQPQGWTSTFDTEAHLADPEAARRLQAPKTLQVESTTKQAAVRSLAGAAAHEAVEDARVLVVCNTIDRARAVHAELRKRLDPATALSLLIGRSRPLDRERVQDDVLTWFGADRHDAPGAAVLVATQTVEVGIDLDATALVTESASWDALVQRIGRVNRRGRSPESRVLVVHDDDPKNPVYGEVRGRTVEFLMQIADSDGQVDVSPLALRGLASRARETGGFLPAPIIPVLLPAHLDAWTRTAPPPTNDAPLDAYLHGLNHGLAPVTLTWRDGLVDPSGEPVSGREADAVISAVPVRSEESIEVPLAALRRWLVQSKPEPLGEWDDEDDWEVPFQEESDRPVVRRSPQGDGTDTWTWAFAQDLRPGDSVVIPTEWGGLDEFGWSPMSTEKVIDVAELAAFVRGRPVLRLDQGLPARLGLTPPPAELWEKVWRWRNAEERDAEQDLRDDVESEVRVWLETANLSRPEPWARGERLMGLRDAMNSASLQVPATQVRRPGNAGTARPDDEQLMLVPQALLRGDWSGAWRDVNEESADGTVHLRGPVSLTDHLRDVGERAAEIVQSLGLSEDLSRVVTDAARWHDLGKVDPRFQAMLFGGDPIRAALADEPRAKSGMPPGDLQQQRDARRRSGLPRRARHEAWSAALVEAFVAAMPDGYAGDAELLIHLVGSHHGHGRPLMPIVVDGGHHQLVAHVDGLGEVTAELPKQVDLPAAERFARLNRRYGRWGLALLETIVRSADTTISGEGR